MEDIGASMADEVITCLVCSRDCAEHPGHTNGQKDKTLPCGAYGFVDMNVKSTRGNNRAMLSSSPTREGEAGARGTGRQGLEHNVFFTTRSTR